MKNIGIKYTQNEGDTINVFQEKIRKLIISKNLITEAEASILSLHELLQYVVIVYLPDNDYKKLCEHVALYEKTRSV